MKSQNLRRALHLSNRFAKQSKYYLAAKLPHEVGVQGSYSTGNIGDLAIGTAIRAWLNDEDITSRLYTKRMCSTSASTTILGGGGVIHDSPPSDLERRLSFLNENSVFLGVGANPISNEKSQQLLSEALDKANLITTRDQRSTDVLQRYTDSEVITTACPALTLQRPDAEIKYKTGINFRPGFFREKYAEYHKDRLNLNESSSITLGELDEEYIKICQETIDQVADPVFIPFTIEDERFAREHLDIDVKRYEYSASKALKDVAEVKKMICTRYHSLVFSIICNIPSVAIAYAPKVEELAERAEIEYCYPSQDSGTLDFKQPSGRGEIIDRSKENFRLLRKEI
ncbi:polysaccharide pyruvyl transferase family protein [Natronococcus sp. A-GB7]|uniref:polysaccharide pyruvyl transferase family protein n=1 Tax=Natronococcus sp. A-GB7 TaxID=3037649 RepID=UPI00241D42E3|nr:polysaccharide pyruvyl transferase family protein [Natronococcus sp. A-GB7]MDG5821295.1 polysaccharide pyruvyl transferase family protein [Natronococcus sp. A-GB7]